jgi:predicted DNA-binding antitoxin AbrB/MazE fold protein
MVVRLVEAQYEDGVLRPSGQLGLRPGERVNIIVVRRSESSRWDLARLAKTENEADLALAEQGLAEWANALDAEDRS